ncbi:hypothetical protein [Kingella pumchi]|jgi:hypothetical protein|uniref:Cold shock domain-containing protein n=1 Tax=Kingella pumchi TaxID=2779506 RepID=A0ABS9NQK4_9NEIS|nr:hypothetical protein [Kingella pumchi]MCG6505077.1 hypothetical protein [Kingella pumchi]
MDSKKISVIKFLNTDKRNGYIKKLDNNAENDFFFVEKELLNITFEQLKEGVEVQFEPNGNFANKIEILKPERSVISSKIKKLDAEKRTGFISKINQNAKKDFVFAEKELLNIKFEQLKEGMDVQFEPNGDFANKINVINNKPAMVEAKQAVSDNLQRQVVNSISEAIETIISSIRENANLITDPYIFEDYTNIILKMLVTEIYPIPQQNQAGMFDGLFKIKNLEVIYDCTLSSNYEDYKREQIHNYAAKLEQTSLTVNGKEISLSKNSDKQIWIITKGSTKKIKEINDIRVKEVDIHSLINEIEKKFINNLNYNDYVDNLKNI